MGFVAAGRYKNAIDLQKAILNGITNPISQMVVAKLMESGGYDRHVRALRRALAHQVRCVGEARYWFSSIVLQVSDYQSGIEDRQSLNSHHLPPRKPLFQNT